MSEIMDTVPESTTPTPATAEFEQPGVSRRGFLKVAAATTAAVAAGTGVATATRASTLAAPPLVRLNAPIELTMWHAKPELRPNYQKVLDAFHADFPDVHITQIPKPSGSYGQLYQTAMAAGTLPDLFSAPSGPSYRIQARSGQLLDLTNKVPNAKNLMQVARDEDFVDGKLFKVSWGRYTVVMMYNKRLLKQLNLQPPVDWADWKNQCKKILAAGIIPISNAGADGSIDAFYFTELATAALGRQGFYDLVNNKIKWTAQPIIDTMQFMIDLMPYYQPGFLATQYAASKALFATEKVVYFEAGSADVPGFKNINPKLEIGVFPFPSPHKGGTTVTLSGLDETMAANPKTKYPNAVYAFQNFCCSLKGGALCSAAVNLSPVVKGVLPPTTFPELAEIIHFSQNDFPVWYAVDALAPGFSAWAKEGQGLFTKRLTPMALAQLLQKQSDAARKASQ